MSTPKQSARQTRGPRCPSCGTVVGQSGATPDMAEPKTAASAKRPASAPFCSDRCKMVDLGRWLGGEHAIAGEPALATDDDSDA
jgi:endogenous inhibitor of DNA gyrase (YacG/DUF329 family)